jgi:hypothetical protein
MEDLTDSFEPSPDQVVEYETVTTTQTTAATKPGPGWERVGPAPTGTHTYELEEPAPTYEQTTKEVTVGYNVTNTTRAVERERTLHVPAATASPASANATTVQGVLQNAPASTSVSFLDVDGANSAVGVGGTIGTTHHGTMAQGDTAVIQLDQPLLFDGERINVQLIDTQTNSLVMDRNVRVQTPEQFQFAPDGTTPPDGATPNGTGTVPVNDSLDPGDGLGNAPDIDPAPGNDTQPPDSDPDGPPDTIPDDGGSDSSPAVGTGDGDGEPQTKSDLDCRFATRTASGGIACVGDQTSGNDDSATDGYTQVCNDADTDCASGDGGALPKGGADDGGDYGGGGGSDTNSGSESDDTGTGGSNYGGSDSGYAKP